MKIDLGKILTRSWQIIWNHKILWVFGIFAGLSGSNSGGNNGGSSNRGEPSQFPGGAERIGEEIQRFVEQYLVVIIAVCVLLVLISFAFYALGMMGRIGILKGVYKVEGGAPSLMFAELWSEAMPYFWRFFWMNFLVGLAFLVIFAPLILVGIVTAGIGFVCLLPIICLLIPIAWAVNVILEQGQAAIVAENLSMLDGFKRGWEIAKSDILGMIVLSLVLGIGGAIIGFVVALPVIVAVIPGAIGMAGFRPGDALPPSAWISIVCCGLYLPVLIFLNGVLTAYIKTAWALSYLQLSKPSETMPITAQADA